MQELEFHAVSAGSRRGTPGKWEGSWDEFFKNNGFLYRGV